MFVLSPGYGLISMRSWPLTSFDSVSTSALARPGLYVIHTAPCSSEWTAFSLAIAFGYTVPVQSAQTGAWSPPVGGDVSYLRTPFTWSNLGSTLYTRPLIDLASPSSGCACGS